MLASFVLECLELLLLLFGEELLLLALLLLLLLKQLHLLLPLDGVGGFLGLFLLPLGFELLGSHLLEFHLLLKLLEFLLLFLLALLFELLGLELLLFEALFDELHLLLFLFG